MPLARHDGVWRAIDLSLKFLLTCLLRGMTDCSRGGTYHNKISTHMPLARHDDTTHINFPSTNISTHMPLARHDGRGGAPLLDWEISTHMPLARHDEVQNSNLIAVRDFYSHASCEA